MKINYVRQINVQLSKEEIATLEEAIQILDDLYETMDEENRGYAICETEYNGEVSYRAKDISSLVDQLEDLTYITEIC